MSLYKIKTLECTAMVIFLHYEVRTEGLRDSAYIGVARPDALLGWRWRAGTVPYEYETQHICILILTLPILTIDAQL